MTPGRHQAHQQDAEFFEPAGSGEESAAPQSGPPSRWRAHFAEWRSVYLAFALSRFLVFALGFGAELYARLADVDPFRPFSQAATFVHYADVVEKGYIFDGAGGAFDNATEYPLLPALMWVGSQVGVPLALTAFVVANVCFLVGLVAFAVVGERYVGKPAARRAAIYLAIFPFAHFFSLASTESLMLAAMFGSVLLAFRASPAAWLGAGGLAALAALARPPGALLGILLLAIAVGQLRAGSLSRRGIAAALAAGAMIPVAVLGFFQFLKYETGDALAAIHAQEQFNREVTLDGPVKAVVSGLNNTLAGSPGQLLEVLATFGAAAALVAFVAYAAGSRYEISGWVLFGAASLLLPLASGVLYQMPRFILLVPPVFWMLGVLGKNKWVHRAALVLFPIVLTAKVVTEVIGVAS